MIWCWEFKNNQLSVKFGLYLYKPLIGSSVIQVEKALIGNGLTAIGKSRFWSSWMLNITFVDLHPAKYLEQFLCSIWTLHRTTQFICPQPKICYNSSFRVVVVVREIHFYDQEPPVYIFTRWMLYTNWAILRLIIILKR